MKQTERRTDPTKYVPKGTDCRSTIPAKGELVFVRYVTTKDEDEEQHEFYGRLEEVRLPGYEGRALTYKFVAVSPEARYHEVRFDQLTDVWDVAVEVS